MKRRTLLASSLGFIPVGLTGCIGAPEELIPRSDPKPPEGDLWDDSTLSRESEEELGGGSRNDRDTAEHLGGEPKNEPDTDDTDPTEGSADETSTTGTRLPHERIKLRDHRMTQRTVYGRRENIVTGIAENLTDAHINSALIHVYFLDGKKEFVWRSGHMCNDIPPHDICEFEVDYSGSSGRPFDVETYEVEVAAVM